MKDLKIYNAFGITPTSTYTAAGLDFYVPNIHANTLTDIDKQYIINAFSASYKKSVDDIVNYMDIFYNELMTLKKSNMIIYHFDDNAVYEEFISDNIFNFIHLYLALDTPMLSKSTQNEEHKISMFITRYIVVSKDMKLGLSLGLNDHILINSGIKVALEPNTVGIFFNKSGRGNKGFDTRACVVDEDYAGFVHLSLAYTKNNDTDGIFYCGDKITQMVILPVLHYNCVCTDKNSYDEMMKDSERGSSGFGSSDIKH